MCTTQVCSVKNIRICHPQEPSSARSSKSDANTLVSNKVLDTDPGPGFDFFFFQFSFLFISSSDHCSVCSDTAACSYRVRDLTPSRQSSKSITDIGALKFRFVAHLCQIEICFCASSGGQVERRKKLEEGPPRAPGAATIGN